MSSKLPVPLWAIFVVAVAALVIFALLPVQVCRDWAFICENTGSRYGYREWSWGTESGRWYKESALESFVKTNQPTRLQHRWTSYAGTGKNIFGGKVLFGHGRPGPIRNAVGWLDEYCALASGGDKLQLYEDLSSTNIQIVQAACDRVTETVLNNAKRLDETGATNSMDNPASK